MLFSLHRTVIFNLGLCVSDGGVENWIFSWWSNIHWGLKTTGLKCPHHSFSLLPAGFSVAKLYSLFLVISRTTSNSSCLSSPSITLFRYYFFLHWFSGSLHLDTSVLCTQYVLPHGGVILTLHFCHPHTVDPWMDSTFTYSFLHLSKHLAQGLTYKWVLNKHLLHWVIQILLMRCLFLTEKAEIWNLWDVIIRVQSMTGQMHDYFMPECTG